jgi:3',5'-nucleoside bisphosphate phosphatase
VSQIDLHIHSTASDGRLTPAAVVRQAADKGLTIIALADHDTIDGIAPALEAARAYPGFTVIPGVEISTDIPHGELHVLGYFINYNDPSFGSSLERFRNSRLERARKMVAKLGDLGIHIEWRRVQEIAGDSSIGRPHIAQAMLEGGHITTMKQAFDYYLARDKPAYVEREKMTPRQTMDLITGARGLPVLAHPLTLDDPEAMIREVKPYGLSGLEVYYGGYTEADINGLLRLTRKYGLIPTGGSDFHGIDATETPIGGIDLPLDAVRQLIALAKRQNPAVGL